VVASTWPVSDAAAATFMHRFYEYLAEGRDKATALWMAKVYLAKRYPDKPLPPYFWASFLLVGDSRPISPP